MGGASVATRNGTAHKRGIHRSSHTDTMHLRQSVEETRGQVLLRAIAAGATAAGGEGEGLISCARAPSPEHRMMGSSL